MFPCIQTLTITFHPRLNLDPGSGAPHFGLLHLVTTNMVFWAKTVIRESLIEFNEYYERLEMEEALKECEKEARACVKEDVVEDAIREILRAATPFLFAFIIEFALIGATMFYNMWASVEPHQKADTSHDHLASTRPSVETFLKKMDWSNTCCGALPGVLVLIINLVALRVFFQMAGSEDTAPDTYLDEYLEKIMRSITNLLGIMAAFFACLQVNETVPRTKEESCTMDKFLLNTGAAFTFVFMGLSINIGLSGAHGAGHEYLSNILVINGILSITQIILQVRDGNEV